ncbi:hypothetical protein [Zobellia russellii]|uniref:hypothetical protein n=1 Tax=Zobellia russellii TaxID=248907 RepID=UPI0037DCF58E
MKDEEFKYQYVKKGIVQELQFLQWLHSLFILNVEINKEYNHNSAELFIVKLVQFLKEGDEYCQNIIPKIPTSDIFKIQLFQRILKFIEDFKENIPLAEFDFLEYKRHTICHIFQNGYEPVQRNLKVKTLLKNRELSEIDNNLKDIISSEKSEMGVQKKLFKKYYVLIEDLRTDLVYIEKQRDN